MLLLGWFSSEYLATPAFVEEVDKLFDSFNSVSCAVRGKELRHLLNDNSLHIGHWTKASMRIRNWDFLQNGKPAIHLHCCSNSNPNVGQFVDALKTSITNGIAFRGLHGTYCEEDDTDLLDNLHSLHRGPDASPSGHNTVIICSGVIDFPTSASAQRLKHLIKVGIYDYNWDSIVSMVGIVTGYGLDNCGVRF
jgi:hypothetical protein